MKIMCITGHDIDLNSMTNSDNYNGRGWIESLIKTLSSLEEVELTVVLLSYMHRQDIIVNGVTFTTVPRIQKSSFSKLIGYYFERFNSPYDYSLELDAVIAKHRPDVVHLFGLENTLAAILKQTTVPVITHIQGVLAACNNAFFPVGFNRFSFLFPVSFREWILRNGFIYAKSDIEKRAKTEINLFKYLNYAMGRTHWDKRIVNLLAPNAQYFHVDEILRAEFYTFSGKWNYPANTKFTIVSTISETIYKGLDLVLKTAQLLKQNTGLTFEWQIIGLNKSDRMVRFFEKKLKIGSDSVNVKYLGVRSAHEICSTLVSTNIYVHPSYIDNSPNSVCEAQLIGSPVIATNVGGVSSLVEHNSTGILVPANAPYELCSQIVNLTKDETFCKRLSSNSIEAAIKRHDKTTIANDLISSYKLVINTK